MDPYELYRPYEWNNQQAGPQVQTLPPAEADSTLQNVLGKILGGVGYAGNLLDKYTGSRALRGVLGGNFNEALSILPFSDAVGLTDEKNRVSGEDLLKQAGVLQGEGEKGTFEMRDLAGPALEMLLNPINALGGGALTALGKADKAKGLLAPTLAGKIAAGQGGLARIGLPFVDSGKVIGTGETAQKIAEGLGSASRWVGSTRPALAAKAMFSKQYQDSTSPLLQPFLAQASAREGPALAALREKLGSAAQAIDQTGTTVNFMGKPLAKFMTGSTQDIPFPLSAAGMNTQENLDLIRAVAEGQASWAKTPQGQLMEDITKPLSLYDKSAVTGSQEIGVPKAYLEGHFPRQMTTPTGSTGGTGLPIEQPLSPFAPHNLGREEGMTNQIVDELGNVKQRGMVGGTAGFNTLFSDPAMRELATNNPIQATHDIATKYLGMKPQEIEDRWLLNQLASEGKTLVGERDSIRAQLMAGGELAAKANVDRLEKIQRLIGDLKMKSMGIGADANEALGRMASGLGSQATLEHVPGTVSWEQNLRQQLNTHYGQAEELANKLPRVNPEYTAKDLRFFGNNPVEDLAKQMRGDVHAAENANAFHGALTKVAVPASEAGPGAVGLDQILKQAGLTGSGANDYQIQKLMDAGKIGSPGDFLKMKVPADQAKELTRYVQSFTKPEAVAPFLKAWDGLTQTFKAWTSGMIFYPSKHVRDFMQNAFMGFVHDGFDPRFNPMNPMKYVKPYQDAYTALRAGGTVAEASKIPGLTKLTDEAATKMLTNEMFARKVAGPERLTAGIEASGNIHAAQKTLIPPGAPQPGMGEILKGAIPRSKAEMNPLGISGVGGRETTTFAPAKASGQVMEAVDDLSRGALYIAKRRQGFTPDAAAEIAHKAMYDFSNLSSFEKSTMRRIIPFYSWMRQNIPAVVKELVERPGGKMGTAVRLEASSRHDQGFVPGYVGQGLAIPLGKEDNGTQRYLSRLDLPHEDAFSTLATGPGGPGQTLRNVLSSLNPLIKAPLELAAGKQFYSGRNLQDLYGSTGNQLVDQAVYNSPISRLVTMTRTALDERKGIGAKAVNLLSPARITDVDLEKARQVEGRTRVEDLLRGNPNIGTFERMYAKPGMAQNLSTEDMQLMRLYQTLEQNRAKKAQLAKVGG